MLTNLALKIISKLQLWPIPHHPGGWSPDALLLIYTAVASPITTEIVMPNRLGILAVEYSQNGY